ncbi:LuxR family transcriptional regulator [Prauserella sp. PE36]|uniref:helix-turn-helix transcriptional regulator n=1 Tax=Prauserella sp. PE36 TaxID=1504709 RepID=UPI000DE3A641|nr:helix-turn-helix transcriptional regulator [Prauserella sp. PE36]RBM16396.1 LuxR family transcriptional regulator [Prauserella sp. PE36]
MLLVPRLGSGIPLVGRADELARLRGAVARAERSEASAVLVAGDAGVGKTRLLAELSADAHDRGALVLTGRCLDVREGGLPYLPFAEALAPLATTDDDVIAAAVRARPALARLLPLVAGEPEAGPDFAQLSAPDVHVRPRLPADLDLGQLQLFDAVLGVLTEVAGHRTVVLVLEDLHWADGATRNLLSFLASRLRSQRLLVIGSYREEDVYRTHPLRALLVELVRLPTVERVDLRPFVEAEARAFVEALAEEPLTAETVADLVARSEGNPFFAEELLASCASGDDVPAGLAELLLARLERLAPDTRRVLRAVAVASDAVSHAALAEVSGLGELELDESLREAVQHHVLVIERGFYQFRHALLQEAVYGDLLPGERTRMHAAYAARIRATPQGRGHEAKLAYHSLRSKDFRTALTALVQAADEAERLGAPGTALRHIEQALEIWDAVPDSGRPEGYDELRLLQEAAHYAGVSGDPERAIAFARSAVQTLSPDLDRARSAMAWRRLAESLLSLDSTCDEAPRAIERAWELVADGEPSRARAWVLATRAQILRGQQRLDEAWWSAETAVADARAAGVGGAEASALVTLGALADSAARVEEARQRLVEAVRKARAAGALHVELRALYYHALSHDDQGEIPAALDLYRQAIERAEETGLTWSSFGIGSRVRYVALRYTSGDWPEDRGERPNSSVSSTATTIMNTAWVHLLVARGRFAEAERLMPELRSQLRSDLWIALAASSGGIELAYWQGEYEEAVRRCREGIGWLDELSPRAIGGIRVGALGIEAAAAWAAAARLRADVAAAGAAVSAGEELLAHVRDCAERGRPRTDTLGPEGQAWLARAEAAASGLTGPADPALWAKAAKGFGYGAVYEQAICRLHHADALLAAGDTGLAAQELGEAHALAERLSAVPLRTAARALAKRGRIALPGLAPPRETVDLLTERERSVLERVALGRTNRQVGEELFISEKTVSVHLSRAMAKLGASRRAEAVAIAYDKGLLTKAAQ